MDKLLLHTAKRHLRKSDKIMARLIKQCDPISFAATRPPHYHALVRAIINQQISVKAGQTIERRLLTRQGGRHFSAQKLLQLKTHALRECGLSNNKARYVHTLAKAIMEGELNFRRLAKQDDNSVRNSLMQYPGIGEWSADMFLISSLRRPDVFPIGDLVLRKSLQHHYQLSNSTTQAHYISIAAAWRPYRTIASQYLWKASH